MANCLSLNTENDDIQKVYTATINACTKYKAPDLFDKEDFYVVYSPKKFKLQPREDMILNLHFNITTSKEIDPWISFLPTLKSVGLNILSKTVNLHNEIEVHLQNQSYYYTVKVQKEQSLAFIFMLGKQPRDLIKTEYSFVYKE